LFFHATVLPTLAGTGFGTNDPVPRVEPTMETVTTVDVGAGVGVGVGVGVVVGLGVVGVDEAAVDELPPQLTRASAAASTELRAIEDRIF
jgi:hypothetical protein